MDKQEKHQSLTTLLRDKSIAHEEEYTYLRDSEGSADAYIAQENATTNTFILKKFYKNVEAGEKAIKALPYESLNAQIKKIHDMQQERIFSVRELIASDIYEMLLFDRAPKAQLVIGSDKNILYVRSKFFQGTNTTLSEFSQTFDTSSNISDDSLSNDGSSSYQWLDPNNPKLRKILGFEKAIASCHIMGEDDYHIGNFMVQTLKGGHQIDNQIIMKIDHGRSFLTFHKDFTTLIDSLNNSFEYFEYQQAINNQNLIFNVGEYLNTLNSMLNAHDEDRINNIIDRVINTLEIQQFNASKLYATYKFDQKERIKIEINDFKKLSDFHKELLSVSFKNMKEIVKDIEIVNNFSNVDENFKNGKWITSIQQYPLENKSPILYASMNNIQINGQNALIWAMDNKYAIKRLTKNSDPIICTYDTTEILDPIEYILDHKGKKELELSQDENEFMQYVSNNNLTSNITGKKYIDIFKQSKAITTIKKWLKKENAPENAPNINMIGKAQTDCNTIMDDLQDIIKRETISTSEVHVKKISRKRNVTGISIRY